VRPYLEKKPSQKRAGGMAQGVGPEFKPKHHKKKKKKKKTGALPLEPQFQSILHWLFLEM
jgi:hypothetical protein